MKSNQIKVLSSLIDPSEMAWRVEKEYSLGTVEQCICISIGDNDNYLITIEHKKYILRIYRYNKYWLVNESDYQFELHWLEYLHQNNLPISYPIPRREGQFLNSIEAPEGKRYWALFSFGFGEVFCMAMVRVIAVLLFPERGLYSIVSG